MRLSNHFYRHAAFAGFASIAICISSVNLGCTEPGYKNEVYAGGQGGQYQLKRVPKEKIEVSPAPEPKVIVVDRPVRTAAQDADAVGEITRIENDFAEALKPGGAISPLLAASYTQTGLTRNVTTRDQFLDDLKNGSLKVASASVAELRVQLSGDTAVATGVLKLSATLRGADVSGDYRFTDTLILREGKWAKLATQYTRN